MTPLPTTSSLELFSCVHYIRRMWCLSMLTAPLLQTDRIAEGPISEVRKVVPFPQECLLSSSTASDWSRRAWCHQFHSSGEDTERLFGILEQWSQKALEELGLATPRWWPNTRCWTWWWPHKVKDACLHTCRHVFGTWMDKHECLVPCMQPKPKSWW